MAQAEVLVERLLALQNPDGGWPYNRGTSWTEPTALVVLALQSEPSPATNAALGRGLSWLLTKQRIPEGGWAPNPSVKECTSVTSVATLAILPLAQSARADLHRASLDRAVTWTACQVYRNDFSLSLLLARTLNLPPARAPGSVPWYPGTAGWVMPTSLSVLALSRAAREANRSDLRDLAAQSCSYLLSRRCADGGWNHGGSKTRSEDATSYPETTGLALLALRAASVTPAAESIAIAARFAAHPESIEGLSWLQLALQHPGQPVPDPPILPKFRTARDLALRLLALSSLKGSNVLLGS
jgi:hypothetical protein